MHTHYQADGKEGRRGYYGDILIGPYVTFGIETDDQSLLKKTQNGFEKVLLVCLPPPPFIGC